MRALKPTTTSALDHVTSQFYHNIFEYLTGEKVVLPKLKKEDYFAKPVGTRCPARVKKAVQTATPIIDDDDETDNAQAILMSTNNNLRQQIDYNEHKNVKEKMKFAGKLLNVWVSDGIKIEIENCANAKKAYDFIKKRYAVTDERARDSLLNQFSDFEFENCPFIIEYINKVRQIKVDFKTVKYDMTDDMFVTAFFHSFPPNYRGFKKKARLDPLDQTR